ncbi:MAG: phosphoglycerate dehydrogenase [Planctomycetaceae bacterium]|nr:phosphoglycerate dehydrogenase [Planctomycetaceae bacterium]
MKPRVRCAALNSDEGPHFDILSAAGFEVLPGSRNTNLWEGDALVAELQGCAASIAGSEPYTRRVLEALPDLRVIARTGVGFDAIDLVAADERGIVVTTTPGVNHHSVAEHTLAMLLGVARGFPDLDQRVREGRWKRIPYPRVMGCTLGLVGLGRIGQAVAWRGVGLGLKVIAYEPYANKDFCEQWKIELVGLDELYARSDYVSLHCPATPETKRMINAESLGKMKRGAVLINTARGALVDEPALIAALESGQLRGAGLDVFDVEPLPTSSPLTQMSNVVLAGHVAGLDIESQRDTLVMAAETIRGLRDGEWPAECIQNLKGQSGWRW